MATSNPGSSVGSPSSTTGSPSSTVSPTSTTSVRHGLSCLKCALEETAEVRLKVCSRCKAGYYCSAGCQKAHWSKHKPWCDQRLESMADAKEQYGTPIVNALNQWTRDSRVGLTALVHKLVTNSQLRTHMLHVMVDYLPEETPQFKIVEYTPMTLSKLWQIDENKALSLEKNMRDGQSLFAKSGERKQHVGWAVVVCRNHEAPVWTLALGTCDNTDETPIQSSEHTIVGLIDEV